MTRPLLFLIVSAAILAVVVGVVRSQDAENDAQRIIVRIYYRDIADLTSLSDYDLFEYNNISQRYVLAAVTDAEIQRLAQDGWVVVHDDHPLRVLGMERNLFYGNYHTVDELYEKVDALVAQYPALSERVVYGQSHCRIAGGCQTPGDDALEGFDLVAVRVTSEAVPGTSSIVGDDIEPGSKPIFFLLANIHAREITTPEIALRWLELLLQEYGKDADITWLVDWHEMWIVLTANPDGHWITELGEKPQYGQEPLLHRKNFNRDANADGKDDCPQWPPTASWQFGVDLNRNHSVGWAAPGPFSSPCEQTYSGTAPASEPEVASLQSLIRQLFPDRREPDLQSSAPDDTQGLLITLHSFGNLVLRPWAFTSEPSPNESGLKAIGDKLATFNQYRSCRPPECLYIARGTTDDWAYGELGIPAFTFELGDWFTPPYDAIDDDQWPRNRDAFLYAARIASFPYQLIHGPDVVGLEAEQTIETANSALVISAVVDERAHGGQIVTAAEYALDTPFWNSEAEINTMQAVDGVFDSAIEEVALQLSPSSLSPGQHMLFVRGQDADGNYGVTSAVIFFIDAPEPKLNELFIPIAVGS